MKGGQFKMPTTYESTILSPVTSTFFDRAQMSRLIGEKRDRGVWAGYSYGDPKGFKGTINVSVSNGSTDDGTSGKTAVDNNAAKDYLVRYDGNYGSAHRFGAYYRTRHHQPEVPQHGPHRPPRAWTTAGVTLQAVKDNLDKTTAEGLFYAYDQSNLHLDVEAATGLVGRRFPTLQTTAVVPVREHLDQKFTTYALTAVYKMGQHQIAARYDYMNYNSATTGTTATSPTSPPPATPRHLQGNHHRLQLQLRAQQVHLRQAEGGLHHPRQELPRPQPRHHRLHRRQQRRLLRHGRLLGLPPRLLFSLVASPAAPAASGWPGFFVSAALPPMELWGPPEKTHIFSFQDKSMLWL